MDVQQIERIVADLLTAMGEDITRDGLRDTPSRMARMYAEMFRGLSEDPPGVALFDNTGISHMIIVKDLPVHSVCEHHLLPFIGRAAVGYVPDEKLAGLSKFGRVIDYFAARPQIQERLTDQVLRYLVEHVKPKSMIVHVECEHLCMSLRGIRKPGHLTQTAAFMGEFEDAATRQEFYANLNR